VVSGEILDFILSFQMSHNLAKSSFACVGGVVACDL